MTTNQSIQVDEAMRLIEEGAASMELMEREAFRSVAPARKRDRFDVIVIGGGQAGLSVGYCLARAGVRFVILDAQARVGDTWRARWDSLRLFTPAKFDSLVGMPFPAPRNAFPTKDEMADYLESYAARFRLPVQSGVRVERLYRRGAQFVAQSGSREFEAARVVVAMANWQRPRLPPFAAALCPDIVQLHSRDYRNPRQLQLGGVLVVGAGNSGAEIAMEVARSGHRVWLSGRDVGQIPFHSDGFLWRNVVAPLVFRVVFHRMLTVRTALGRKVRGKMLNAATPLIRVRPRDLAAAGIERVARVVGVRHGAPLLADGRVLDLANVIWSSGFSPAFDWIDLPIFGADGEVLHEAGVVESEPGLYFVGLHFLYAMSSSMIHGLSRDADRIVQAIMTHMKQAASQSIPPAEPLSAAAH